MHEVSANSENEKSESTSDVPASENPVDTTASYNLARFQLKQVLNNNTIRKSIALLGTFPDQSSADLAIVLLEKEAFKVSDVCTDVPDADNSSTNPIGEKIGDGSKEIHIELGKSQSALGYFNDELKVQTEFVNNIYGSYKCTTTGDLNSLKATVVYPATDKHIQKYSVTQKFLINETPSLYERLTLPYLEDNQLSLDWVYNILEHKQEVERIVFEDSDSEHGFILLPDLKWDGRNVSNLYLLAITHKRKIKSIRDLNEEHLPLLKNIKTKASEAIERKYGVAANKLRMYFHYQPSFYHLHVHINSVQNDAPGIWCEKSHMLETVINNIELLSDYYKRATIPFVLYDGHKLFQKYEEELSHSSCKRLKMDANDEATERKRPKVNDADDNIAISTVEA